MNYESIGNVASGIGSFASLFIVLIICVLILAGYWKVFEKAGLAGWKCLIPFYSSYCVCRIALGNGILFLLGLIPCVGIIFNIYLSIKLANAFGKGVLTGLILFFISPIGYPYLGFSDAKYIGPQL